MGDGDVERDSESLILTETFYSIQGEGRYAGVPSVFIRLHGCNLRCGYAGGTWRCDTPYAFREEPDIVTIDSIIGRLKFSTFLRHLQDGAHLVVTGGEPLLQQDALAHLLLRLTTMVDDLFVEVETNGTVMPSHDMLCAVDHFTVSPKLSNSGVSRKQRMVGCVLALFADTSASFKFVVLNDSDVAEVIRDFVAPLELDRDRVFLMPATTTADNRQTVAELCKRYHFRYSPRLHIDLWGGERRR